MSDFHHISEVLDKIVWKLKQIEMIQTLPKKSHLNLTEASFYTGYSKSFLYSLCSQRKLGHFKSGGRLFFTKKELDQFILNKKNERLPRKGKSEK